MASTTALPPPTSISRREAGHFVCWLFLLQGLCRSDRLPAVFTARPVPATSSAGCLLQRPCFALPCLACLPLPWPHAFGPCSVLHSPSPPPPVHYHVRQDHRASCRDCPVGSRIMGLHWRPVHRFCCCVRSSRVLQGLPCRQPHHGTALAARAPLLFTAFSSKGGGLGLRVSSRPHSLSPALFHEPETACE